MANCPECGRFMRRIPGFDEPDENDQVMLAEYALCPKDDVVVKVQGGLERVHHTGGETWLEDGPLTLPSKPTPLRIHLTYVMDYT